MINNAKKEIVQQDGRLILRNEYYEGPFPHPDDLAKYEAVQPRLINRIFDYAEAEQVQRHLIQKKQIDTEMSNARSQFLIYLITSVLVTLMYVVLIAAGCYALYLGHIKTSLVIFAPTIVRVMIAMTRMVQKNQITD